MIFLSTWISILRAPLTSPAPTINISRKITARSGKHLGDKVRQTYGSHFPCSPLPLQLKVQGVWHRICLPVPQSSYTRKSLQIIHYKLRSSHSALGFFFFAALWFGKLCGQMSLAPKFFNNPESKEAWIRESRWWLNTVPSILQRPLNKYALHLVKITPIGSNCCWVFCQWESNHSGKS